MAPEIHPYVSTNGPNEKYTNAVDLWAVGCITYRIVTGEVPFPGASLLNYARDGSLFPSATLLKNGIKSSCTEFMKGLLNTSPNERPSASQALKAPWIIGRCKNIFSLVALPLSCTLLTI
jgi:serine/threonine protein kinase